MKYRQLSKEQFLALHQEFAHFLATQQIDTKEWALIKKEKPAMAEEELNIFSDVVWEDVLTKTKFLEHTSQNQLNLFQCNSKEMVRICVKLNDKTKNFLNEKDFEWFVNNPLHNSIEYFKAVKKYSKSRNFEIFELIEMGGQISNGDLFKKTAQLIA